MFTTKKFDFVIIGSGIIGLTIAHAIKSRQSNATILIIDKEDKEAEHASGRNSGILHAGFYYTADSLKARFTREGNALMKAHCDAYGLWVNRCGKLVVAKDEADLVSLDELFRRGRVNGVDLQMIGLEEA